MSLGRGYQVESATFDDVAMILLFFFLVMAFFAFNKKFLDLDEEKKQRGGPPVAAPLVPVPPTLDLVTHSELDFLLYVDAESAFRIVNLGGNRAFEEVTIDATPDAKMEGFKSTERSDSATSLRRSLVPSVKSLLEAEEWQNDSSRLFIGGHPKAVHGALFQSYAGYLLTRRDLKSFGYGDRLMRVPCPASDDALEIARALSKRNRCVLTKLETECLVTNVSEASKRGGACQDTLGKGGSCSEEDQVLLTCALQAKDSCEKPAGEEAEDGKFCDWKVFEKDREKAAEGTSDEGVQPGEAPQGAGVEEGQLDKE